MSLVPTKVIRLRGNINLEFYGTDLIKLLGVPFRATKQDIINFLGISVHEDKIQILKNMWNKPSGWMQQNFVIELGPIDI